MKALISQTENNRICQVQEVEFDVALPLIWVNCPNDCTTDWSYINGEFIKPSNIKNEEQNKQIAILLLKETDWTESTVVADPAQSNPYLTNRDQFIAWRSQVRAIAVNPVAGELDIFEQMPDEVWQSV